MTEDGFPRTILNLEGQPKYVSPIINLKKLEKLKQEILPMTAMQQQAIARLCRLLNVRQPIEERIKSQAEAGKAIKELETEIKCRRCNNAG